LSRLQRCSEWAVERKPPGCKGRHAASAAATDPFRVGDRSRSLSPRSHDPVEGPSVTTGRVSRRWRSFVRVRRVVGGHVIQKHQRGSVSRLDGSVRLASRREGESLYCLCLEDLSDKCCGKSAHVRLSARHMKEKSNGIGIRMRDGFCSADNMSVAVREGINCCTARGVKPS
jgi:hypothetical protein